MNTTSTAQTLPGRVIDLADMRKGDQAQDAVGWSFIHLGDRVGCTSDISDDLIPTTTEPVLPLRLIYRDGAPLDGTGTLGRIASVIARRY